MNVLERCVNCEQPVSAVPVYFDGRSYCCAGCVSGGPCVCTYEAAGSRDALLAVGGALAAAAAPRSLESREPTPIRPELAARAIVVRIGGFADQRELLLLADRLEQEPALMDVALSRAEAGEAWFSLRASSAEQVALVLEGLAGFTIRATAFQSSVDARVLPADTDTEGVPPMLLSPAEREQRPEEAVLPPRPRFRVFSRLGGAAQPSSSWPVTSIPAQPQVSTSAPVPVVPAPAVPAPASMPPAAPATPEPVLPGPAPVLDTVRPGMIAADDRPGGAVPVVEHLTLVVYPFHSFVALNEFQAAIRRLHGVSSTRVRRFYRGTLHLAVDYEDIIPLTERLHELSGFRWQVVSESRQEIELVLEESGALIAAEGDA